MKQSKAGISSNALEGLSWLNWKRKIRRSRTYNVDLQNPIHEGMLCVASVMWDKFVQPGRNSSFEEKEAFLLILAGKHAALDNFRVNDSAS